MNIAEGSGRKTAKDFLNFLYISRGFLQETKYQLLLSKDLGYINDQVYEELIERCYKIGRLLNGLINVIGGKKSD